jgi:hypothetical protein
MLELLKLPFSVFLRPKNYNEMLVKLGAFILWESYVITFLLRGIKSIDEKLHSVESYEQVTAVLSLIPNHEKLNPAGFFVALAVAYVSRAIQLHDRISDVLGIRRRFDRNYILLPLAVLVGAELKPQQLTTLAANRDTIMREVFYRYASSRADKPLVDRHDIEGALDAWSWYWVLVEGTLLALSGALIAALFGSSDLTAFFSLAFGGLWLLASLYYLRLERFARPEIEAIATNEEAKLAVRKVFHAL